MLFILILLGLVFSGFYYCEALKAGLGLKRWAFVGFLLGPVVWPMFYMQKRMKTNRTSRLDYLVLKA